MGEPVMKSVFARMLCMVVVVLPLLGCTQRVAERIGNSIVQLGSSDRPVFVANAVRPVFDCKTSPDPRYPCAGLGPEGFVRDLVALPITDHVFQIDDEDARRAYRIKWTWYAMQGDCFGFGDTILRDGRTFRATANGQGRLELKLDKVGNPLERGFTKRSSEEILETGNARYSERTGVARNGGKLVWPPQRLCETNMDVSAGRLFSASLWIWKPDPGDPMVTDTTIDHSWVAPPSLNQFKTGCRTEQRNGLTWDVCIGLVNQPIKEVTPQSGGYAVQVGVEEVQLGRWIARLGDSGFTIEVWERYRPPIFQYPRWYVERQAGFQDVIDSIRFESSPL
jgi:hypothetical protein